MIILYANYYLANDDPRRRFYGILLLFMGSMVGIVLSDHLLQLLIFWGLASFLHGDAEIWLGRVFYVWISVFNLYTWGQRANQSARAAGPTGSPVSKEDLVGENERLRRELSRITEQRDILKKAAGILSEPSPSGMPGLKR